MYGYVWGWGGLITGVHFFKSFKKFKNELLFMKS